MNGEHGGTLGNVLAARQPRRRTLGMAAGAALVRFLGGRTTSASAQEATPASHPSAPVATPATGRLEVRKNGKNLDASERQAFVDAVRAVKKKPSPWAPGLSVYDTFVLWHRDAFGCAVMAAHMGPAFLPWHRQFLRMFEQQLQSVEPTVTLPYWDWTVDNTADAYLWADDFMGGNGDPTQNYAVTNGPFRKSRWQINIFDYNDTQQFPALVREFGATEFARTLPTADDLEAALSIPTYDAEPWNTMTPPNSSFRNTLEGWRDCVKETCDPVMGMETSCGGDIGLHNQVHLWITGEFALASAGGKEAEPEQQLVVAATPSPSTDLFGTMAANTSLNDPVFWLHHANIDRIWSEWMRRHGAVYLPVSGGTLGHNIDDPMWPYTYLGMTVTPRMMLASRDLGYVYDTEVESGT